ncbi:UNVERIFIED_CONTAM: hypothetical protein Scaly_1798700 [Sesamum calycinum]|uniref:CCHC-type domain-containing protein n=1 Tax=Sesamum calycinum TaxID=2727403 RepID=A0AAW2NW98_9LAMI
MSLSSATFLEDSSLPYAPTISSQPSAAQPPPGPPWFGSSSPPDSNKTTESPQSATTVPNRASDLTMGSYKEKLTMQSQHIYFPTWIQDWDIQAPVQSPPPDSKRLEPHPHLVFSETDIHRLQAVEQIFDSSNFKLCSSYCSITDAFSPFYGRHRFPNLPIEYYDFDVLFHIAKLIGRPIKMDQHTFQKQRCKFARVCVEVDMSIPLPPFLHIHHHHQQVRYELNTLFCYRCGSLGHVRVACPLSSPETQSSPQDTSATPATSVPISGLEKHALNSNKWEIVRPKGRRRTVNNMTSRGRNTEEMLGRVSTEKRDATDSGGSSQQRWVAKHDLKQPESIRSVSNRTIPLTNTFHVLEKEDEIIACDVGHEKNVKESIEIDGDIPSEQPESSADMECTKVPTLPDHSTILACLNLDFTKPPRMFRFENAWTLHPDYVNVLNLVDPFIPMHIKDRILSTPIPSTTQSDTCVWNWEKTGKFTIKSAYEWLFRLMTNISTSPLPWKVFINLRMDKFLKALIPLLRDCKELMLDFEALSISFCYREANFAADMFACPMRSEMDDAQWDYKLRNGLARGPRSAG